MTTSAAHADEGTVAGLTLQDPALAATVRDGLARTEAILAEACRSDDPLLADTAPHLALAGGKRFRPLMTLLSALLGDYPHQPSVRDRVDKAAVVVELTHLATLYHDDVMDEALLRRGAESVNSRWGNSLAILSGDYLFAKASVLVAELGPEAVRLQAVTFQKLVVGQVRETSGPRPGEDPIDHHLDVLAGKTASLIATAGEFGAGFAGCPPEVVAACRDYGAAMGTAFQLSDDLIDITSDSDDLGKATGTDLREGIRTLPILYALADPDTDPRLRELLAGPIGDDADHAEAIRLMRSSAGLRRARRTLEEQLDRGRAALERLPAGPARDALASVADYLAARSS